MPRNPRGLQLISFSIEKDEDQKMSGWITVAVKKGDSVFSIASALGHVEEADKIAKANNIRSAQSKFTGKGIKKIKVPREMRKKDAFHVLPQNKSPVVTGGYAKYAIIDRPERVGLTVFEGYDPVTMDVPILFYARREEGGGGIGVEADIRLLERMAGRGQFEGVGVGPSPVIRVSVTDGDSVVPLIPHNYQWSEQNKTGPLWRVTGIDWDDEPLRNSNGNRVRQMAVVSLQQHTTLTLASRSATQRARTRPRPTRARPGRNTRTPARGRR